MRLIVKKHMENRGFVINNKEELIDVIKRYVMIFLPEDDDHAYKMFWRGHYNDLIDDLKLYQEENIKFYEAKYNNPKTIEELIERYNNINKIFMLLGEVEELSNLNEIVNRLDDFNDLFGKVEYDVYFFPNLKEV